MSPAISLVRGKTSMVKQVLPGLLLEAAHSRRCYCGQALTLNANATQLGTYAAQVAQRLGVGIEIEYETNTRPNLTALQQFTGGYRRSEEHTSGLQSQSNL